MRPTPGTDGLSHADLAFTAVAYFVAVMATLLVLGRLSTISAGARCRWPPWR
jgi:hypothetical protein